jgi:bacillithiol biosynthesis cysteine-adding enzyme BshC
MMAVPMECHCLRPAELPHVTHLYATYLDDFGRLSEFYAHPPTEQGILAAAAGVHHDSRTLPQVVEVLREQNERLGADGATSRSLDRLAAGAVAIVTGQQVGLFSGPSYSIYKALSAIHIAQQLSKAGPEAVPVFWLATEDHDLAEINHCYWLGRRGLERFEVQPPDGAGRRVGEVRLGEPVRAAVARVRELLEGPWAEEVGDYLAESYSPDQTFGSAFGRLMGRLFAGQGIILLDPLDPRFHRLMAPIYRRAAEQNAALTGELRARSKKLEKAGYHAQVKVTERSTLLFLSLDGQRLPIRLRGEKFVAGSASFSLGELLDTIERVPEAFSANVLLRPVVQDALLPTAAYVGGPAEIAYYAQAEVAYRRLLGTMPAIVPRASFTLIEPQVARLLKKYGLGLRDVLRGRQHLRGKMERQFLAKALTKRFDTGEKTIRRLLAGLRTPLGKLDQTLLGALETAQRKMLYQFLRLRRKAGRAQNLRTGVVDAHERQVLEALFPHHDLQERTHCFLPLLARHGPGLLAELRQRTGTGVVQHQVLFL